MKFSQLVAPTLREDPSEAEVISHKLLLRAGFIRKLAAGIYTYLPLGQRVLSNVITIIREEMNRAGAQEIFMPALQPKELWEETKRWGVYGKELFRIQDRHERDFCLGPTHEEVVTDLVRHSVKSYKNLPVTLYQIQTKFRDEIRPRFGLMRGREFMMKDAYSFHTSEESLDKEYKNMHDTYCRIFDRMGLEYKVVKADSGVIGGGFSQEFVTTAKSGEGVEVGHIFKLGTKYSEAMKCTYIDENNKEQVMTMGCYGIGVSRIAQGAIEQHHDKDGIVWPMSLAPFKVAVVPVNAEEKDQMDLAGEIYNGVRGTGYEVLLDDRPGRLGMKLKDIDLIGIPIKIIIGPKGLEEGKVEVKYRSSGKTEFIRKDEVVSWLKQNALS
ncbi:proline--tRNA ligase [Candidatus Margulisiibacteriota bacterium]